MGGEKLNFHRAFTWHPR